MDDAESGGVKGAFAHQRQQHILMKLRVEQRVDAAQIAQELGVTGETVRKDLIALERMGQLRRVHGGALPPESLSLEPVVSTRVEFAAEKARIARAALRHLPNAGTVLLDAGSTLERFAELLPGDRELTVFTNTLSVAMSLVVKPRITVFTLGGRLRHPTLAEVDEWALRSLAETNVDVAFLGTNGISLERGLTTPDPAEAAIKRAMVRSAQRRILLSDHSKYGIVSTTQHARVEDIDLLISDRALPPEAVGALRGQGVEVELV